MKELLIPVRPANESPCASNIRRSVSEARRWSGGYGVWSWPREQKEEIAPGNLSFAPAHAQLTIFREKIRRPNSARQPVKSAARVHREATELPDGTEQTEERDGEEQNERWTREREEAIGRGGAGKGGKRSREST